MTRAYTQMQRTDKYSEHNSIIWPLWRNGSVFVLRTKWFWVRVQLQSLKFQISRLPWHSGNYRVWIHSEARTWHDKNIRSPGDILTILLKNDCGCEPRFLLYMFPGIKRNFKKRESRMKRLKRATADNKEWNPCGNDRVSNEHFVDGILSAKNPNPTLKLGYQLKQTKLRRTLFRETLTKNSKKLPASSASTQSTNRYFIRCSIYVSTTVTILIMSRSFFTKIRA